MIREEVRISLSQLIDRMETVAIADNRSYLRDYSELRATITHWLYDEKFQFLYRSAGLVKAWELEKIAYLEALRDSSPSVADQLVAQLEIQSSSDFSFIDLFAGIGGFRLALEGNGGSCVFSSEWDKSAKETYFKNHLETPFGDINQFTDSDSVADYQLDCLIPDHDVLAAGFPCQPFSRAGVSARESLGQAHGFECETQGTLFYSIERIAKIKRPKLLFLENVRNITSHDEGNTFRTIREKIEQQGYKFYPAIINAESVVPQQRVRCYMVCVRNDVWESVGKQDFEFPAFDGSPRALKEIINDSLTAAESDNYTISDRLWAGHKLRSQRNIDRGAGFVAVKANLDRPANTIVARYGKDGKECLVPQKGKNPRYLTIRECADLFGYPKDFILPESRTPAYKQLGNSVVVPVITEIAQAFLQQYKIIDTQRKIDRKLALAG